MSTYVGKLVDIRHKTRVKKQLSTLYCSSACVLELNSILASSKSPETTRNHETQSVIIGTGNSGDNEKETQHPVTSSDALVASSDALAPSSNAPSKNVVT